MLAANGAMKEYRRHGGYLACLDDEEALPIDTDEQKQGLQPSDTTRRWTPRTP